MTTEEKKKLLNALKVLREECNKHVEACYRCPLRSANGCNLRTQRPDTRHLSNEKEDIWRAFT